MRLRIVASGVAIAVLGGIAPTVLAGSASAVATSTALPAITGCSPKPATMGTTFTIHGTGLAKATVTIDNKPVTATKDAATFIKAPVPKRIKVTSTVKVVTAKGSTSHACTFKKAKKSPKK